MIYSLQYLSTIFLTAIDFLSFSVYTVLMEIYVLEDYATSQQIPLSSKLTSSKDTSKHSHLFFEIFYVVSGEIQHMFNDQHVEKLQTGDMVLLTPKDCHEFFRAENAECSHRDIMINNDFFKELCNFTSPDLYNEIISGRFQQRIHINLDLISMLEHKISVISQISIMDASNKTANIRIFAAMLLEPFISNNYEKNVLSFPNWFKELLLMFEKSAYMKEGLKAITSNINYDEKYLCRVFKKYMGMTMTEYFNAFKLNYALTLIQSTDKNIAEIALELGFSSVSHFNVIFKKKYGITPLRLRFKNR